MYRVASVLIEAEGLEGQGREVFEKAQAKPISFDSLIRSAEIAVVSAEKVLDAAVRDWRAAGASWADIGRTLRITRQAAQQRFRHVAGDD